jgi:predicted ATPase/DNA-binding SARP family transcriptional activator
VQRLRILLFGSPQVELDGAAASLETRKALALLAYLALEDRSHSRESLATLLWPDFSAERAFHNLRRSLWAINKALGKEWITGERDSLRLPRTPSLWIDVQAFSDHLSGLESHGHPNSETCPACLPHLEAAAALYRAPFLEGFALPDSPGFEDWQFFKREELKRQAASALEKLASAKAEAGDLAAAIQAAQRWLHDDPLHEPAHRSLMQLFIQSGQRLMALRQYEGLKAALAKELGEPPQPETTRLYESLRAARSAEGRVPSAPSSARSPEVGIVVQAEEPAPRSNLPHDLTPFVGRRPELEEIKQRLVDPGVRLLTLMGPGGIGKTRLAIQAASEVKDSFRSGVFFVYLAPLSAPEAVLPAIAKTLRFQVNPASDSPIQQLCDYLRRKQILLILDNFEHLVSDETLQLVLDLLESTPQVKVLVTSRSRLELKGEHVFPVAGMRLPRADQAWDTPHDLDAYSGLQLFIQSASRIQPKFQLTHANFHTIVAICQAVQGMPLGIELATSWMEMLTPEEVLAEIRHSLDFLETTQHNVPERQRSLRAVFEISWSMLSPAERQLFRQLTVFSGGFNRQAAQEVAGASLSGLSSLVNKSFLYWRPNGRYELHELLRQYGLAELERDPEEQMAATSRHSAYYLRLLAQHGLEIYGPKIHEALAILDADAVNVRAAVCWGIEQRNLPALEEALFGLFTYFSLRGVFTEVPDLLGHMQQMLEHELHHPQGRLLMAKVLPLLSCSIYDTVSNQRAELVQRGLELVRAEGLERELGAAYSLLGREYASRIDPQAGMQMLQESLEWQRQDSPLATALSLQFLGSLQLWMGDNQAARQSLEEAQARGKAAGNLILTADTQSSLSGFYYRERNYAEAERLLIEASKTYEALGDRERMIIVLADLGSYAESIGDFERSLETHQKMFQINQDIGNLIGQAIALSWQSIAHLRYGDLEQARQLRLQSLKLASESHNTSDTVWGTLELGEIERVSGNYADAAGLFRQVNQLHVDTRLSEVAGFYHKSLGDLALNQGQLEQAEEHFTHSANFARRDYNYWCLAYATQGLGRVALSQADLPRACKHFRKALARAHQLANIALSTLTLAGMAEYYAASGETERAVELAALLLSHKATWNETRERLSDLVAGCAPLLTGAAFSAAQARGRQLSLEGAIAAILEAE